MKNLKFATSNINKLKEANIILWFDIEQLDIELDEIQNIQIEDLIRHKAKQAYEIAGEPVIIEDTWLFISAWNWLPWALIKWFIDSVWAKWIIDMMSDFIDRAVKAKCIVAMYNWKDYIMWVWEISWRISDKVSLWDWFWFDYIFIPDWYDLTFAELWKSVKNTFSHRKLAFEDFKSKLT